MSCLCCCGNRRGKNSRMTDTVASTSDVGPISYNTLTAHDRKIIKDSSEIIFNKMHLENKGVAFLIGFFKKHPQHQKLFKAFRNIPPDELTNLPKATNHGRKVMDQIALLVVHIEEPMAMEVQLGGLRDRHRKRKVQVWHLNDMLLAFVDFVRQQMGHRFSEEVEAAWNKMIAMVIGILDEDEQAHQNVQVEEEEVAAEAESLENLDSNVNAANPEQKQNGVQSELPVVTPAPPADLEDLKVKMNDASDSTLTGCGDSKSNGNMPSDGLVTPEVVS